jgi:predicted phosphoribosyltransferase
VTVRNEELLAQLPGAAAEFEALAAAERAEVERREHAYRSGRPPLALAGRSAVLVDDGVATGATARAAIAAARAFGAARVVFATPVASAEACARLRADADEVVCLETPRDFVAVGAWYHDFAQVEDETVRRLLDAAARSRVPQHPAGDAY